jgi:ribosomal protein S18 acetylase RimI-like enzyme
MHIRPLDDDDLSALVLLLCQLDYAVDADEAARRTLRVRAAKDHHALVAEIDGRVVGLLHVYERPALEKPSEAVVQTLVVDEARRQEGVGKALMREAEAWARARALTSITLHTRIDREGAQTFYAKLGYTTTATARLMTRKL